MKKSLILTLLIAFSLPVFCQITTDSLTLKKQNGGYRLYSGTQQIPISSLGTAIKSNEQAYSQFQKAQTTNVLASIVAGVGGYIMGYQLGTAIKGGKSNWPLFGFGVGITALSIQLGKNYLKQIQASVNTYNQGLTSNPPPTSELKMGFTTNGLTLALHF